MAGEDDFKDELGKRGRQIAGLREELWAARDRVDEAEGRGGQLRQSITKLEVELGIRRAKANGLEDQAALREAESEDAVRSFTASAAAAAATIAQLQLELAEAEESSSRASASAESELRSMRDYDAEVVDAKARLSAAERDSERLQAQLAQQQELEKELHARLLAAHEKLAADQVDAARRLLHATMGEAGDAKSRASGLEAELALEKERRSGLDTALRHVMDKQKQATQEHAEFEEALRGLQAQEAEGELQETLNFRRRELQGLGQEVAEVKRSGLMRTQGIQGALEETMRMMRDHLDQTQNVPPDPMIGVLKASLDEAKAKSTDVAETARRSQKECSDLEQDVTVAQAASKAAQDEQEQQGRARAAALEKDIAEARRVLEDCQRRQRQLCEDARRAEADAVAVERSFVEQEMVLRAKREELLRPLRWQASHRAASPTKG